MPCHNGEKFIAFSILSVLQQTYKNLELIIVDDNSTDNSLQIIHDFARKDERIRIFAKGINQGAGQARNLGIDKAQGRFIAFLDCDDEWLPQKLELQIKYMTENNIGFCWCHYDVMNEAGMVLYTQKCLTQMNYLELLYKKSTIGCLTAIYDTTYFQKQIMPEIRMRQDYALWLKLLKIAEEKNIKVGGLAEVLAIYRIYPRSLSSNKFKAAWYQWKLYRDIEKLSLLATCHAFLFYAWRALMERNFFLCYKKK